MQNNILLKLDKKTFNRIISAGFNLDKYILKTNQEQKKQKDKLGEEYFLKQSKAVLEKLDFNNMDKWEEWKEC